MSAEGRQGIRIEAGTSAARWGRALNGVVAGLLLVSGAYLIVNAVPDADDLRRSGVDWEDLTASRPAAAAYLERLLRLAAVAAAGLGAMAVLGVLAMRSGGRPVWRMLWALPATTAGITALLAAEGTPVAWYYGGMTLLSSAGLVLARPGKEEG